MNIFVALSTLSWRFSPPLARSVFVCHQFDFIWFPSSSGCPHRFRSSRESGEWIRAPTPSDTCAEPSPKSVTCGNRFSSSPRSPCTDLHSLPPGAGRLRLHQCITGDYSAANRSTQSVFAAALWAAGARESQRGRYLLSPPPNRFRSRNLLSRAAKRSGEKERLIRPTRARGSGPRLVTRSLQRQKDFAGKFIAESTNLVGFSCARNTFPFAVSENARRRNTLAIFLRPPSRPRAVRSPPNARAAITNVAQFLVIHSPF